MYSSFEHGQEGCEEHEFYSNLRGAFEQSYKIYGLHKISDKILKALCFIYNRKRNHPADFKEELCWYLYYWLGDKIYPKVQNQTVFSKIINMIYNELYMSSEYFIICDHINTKIDLDRFNKNKVLFDYSKDNKKIEIDTVYGNTTCDKDYKEYITEYINMYKKAYSDCYITEENKFDCDTFSKLFSKDQYTELISHRCTESQNQRVALQVQETTSQVPPQTVHLLLPASRDSNKISTPEALTGSHRNPGSQVPYALKEEAFLSMKDTTESGSSKTIAGSVVPVLGVSSFSLLLYKVTPVGGYINRLLGRNKNMYNHIEYMDSFNPYSDGMVPGDRRMNISYHRL
ncbi:hypothetical protein PVBG_06113 [Plasmodium vivax Brazil I]|uniref:VIR protein n=1 Tax=Plasmodium vivax (strain Brazil I) TaxID=1033975 RepID=A0A0J9SYP0_PLAV1|nr:hypothetical protein PVBG_06113 [Plasmodium vivax Brazil I]